MATMTLGDAKERWLPAIEAKIAETLQDGSFLGEMSTYHFSTGGKRLRALIPAWLCHNLGGAAEDALDLGAGLEILHNATLVHDDLQDGDTHRRGMSTIWTRFGQAQAINVGDSLFFQGLERMTKSPAGSALIGPVCQAMHQVVRGQVMEFQLQLPPTTEGHLEPTIASFNRMARGKTGALFGACLMSGARAAGLTQGESQAFYDYGEDLGLLFQVQDDYLDLVGNKGRDLKGTDLAEGKRSYPVVWALSHGSKEAVAALEQLLTRPREEISQADIDVGLGILDSTGAMAHTAQWLREARDKTLESPLNEPLPGLAAYFLSPVLHAL